MVLSLKNSNPGQSSHRLGSRRGRVHPRLLRDLSLLLLAVVGLLGGVVFHFGAEQRKEFATELVRRIASDTGRELRSLFSGAGEFLDVVHHWGQEGVLAQESPEQLKTRLLPLLEKQPQVAGLALADDQGSEFFLVRHSNHWLVRQIRQEKGRSVASWSPNPPPEEFGSLAGYDPRQRPWFEGAVRHQGPGLAWTDPYRFQSLQKLGITASTKWSYNGRVYVGAVDMLLETVVAKLTEPPLGESGQAFLLEPQGKILMSTAGTSAEGVQPPAVQTAAAQWQVLDPGQRSFFSFSLAGGTWIGGFAPLESIRGTYWVGVTFPEKFFTGEVSRQRLDGLFLAGLIVALGIGGVFFLLRRHLHHAAEMPQKVDSSRLLELVAEGEGVALEFKSTMRTNLKSGKPDKAIELAWLKTVVAFLNGQGGVLLLGVDDNGQMLGLEADEFSNDDKCRLHFKNLLNQHVGADFSDMIVFDLIDYQGIKVGVVRCCSAPRPVFLRHGQSEEFYIRSGPASVPLTGSQLLSYLQHR